MKTHYVSGIEVSGSVFKEVQKLVDLWEAKCHTDCSEDKRERLSYLFDEAYAKSSKEARSVFIDTPLPYHFVTEYHF